MLINHRSFIEDALNGKITKINPIGSVCEGRITCYVTLSNRKKYFVKIYSHKNHELYLREKNVLVQLAGTVVPELIIADDKKRVIITKYIKGHVIRSLKGNALLAGIVYSFLEFLRVSGKRKLNHGIIAKKYVGLLEECLPNLNFKTIAKDISSSLSSQPKCGCHGDFQPRNIMVASGRVCIIDFESLCFDTPLLDAVRFSFSPDLKVSYKSRIKILGKFVKKLKTKFDFEYSKSIVDNTCIYWAITCAGFYLSTHKKETEKGGKYNYILEHCLSIILKLAKNYE